jgi:TM2 domain-containing membrane protein YozV
MSDGPLGAEAMMRYDANKKFISVAYLLWLFFGPLGGHRLYLQHRRSALVMLGLFLASLLLAATGIGLVGLLVLAVWTLTDAFLIPGFIRAYNNELIDGLSGRRNLTVPA